MAVPDPSRLASLFELQFPQLLATYNSYPEAQRAVDYLSDKGFPVQNLAIVGTDLRNIAPSRRLYAGGGGSVRGYGFREIGPRDDLGEPSGGRSVVEVGLEARIRTGFMDGAVRAGERVAEEALPRIKALIPSLRAR